jgi:hypothetical protein
MIKSIKPDPNSKRSIRKAANIRKRVERKGLHFEQDSVVLVKNKFGRSVWVCPTDSLFKKNGEPNEKRFK